MLGTDLAVIEGVRLVARGIQSGAGALVEAAPFVPLFKLSCVLRTSLSACAYCLPGNSRLSRGDPVLGCAAAAAGALARSGGGSKCS